MDNISKNVFKKELKFYEDHKREYLKAYKGQFVLIKNEQLIGAFTTEVEAYKMGVEKFGTEPFLIKQVLEQEATEAIPAATVGVINVSLQ